MIATRNDYVTRQVAKPKMSQVAKRREGLRKQHSALFSPERDRARRRESNPVIPTKKTLPKMVRFFVRFQSLMYATHTKSWTLTGSLFRRSRSLHSDQNRVILASLSFYNSFCF